MASIILAVWYPYEGAQVFSLPLGGSCVKVPYAIGGSGSSFIYGYVDSNFREKMTLEEAKTFVKNGIDCYLIWLLAISLAQSRDTASGGCIRIVNIHKDGFEREFIPYNDAPFK